MYKRIIVCSFFLLLLLIPTATISAQTMEEADQQFEKGSMLLSRGDYAKALEKLVNAAQIYLSLDAERESMGSLYKTGECLLMLGYYEMAL